MSVNRAITWTTYCLYAYAAHVYRLNISEVASSETVIVISYIIGPYHWL